MGQLRLCPLIGQWVVWSPAPAAYKSNCPWARYRTPICPQCRAFGVWVQVWMVTAGIGTLQGSHCHQWGNGWMPTWSVNQLTGKANVKVVYFHHFSCSTNCFGLLSPAVFVSTRSEPNNRQAQQPISKQSRAISSWRTRYSSEELMDTKTKLKKKSENSTYIHQIDSGGLVMLCLGYIIISLKKSYCVNIVLTSIVLPTMGQTNHSMQLQFCLWI